MTFLIIQAHSICANSVANDSNANILNLDQTKPYCIGRYIVDIPAEANPLERYDKYDSFTISSQSKATRQDFDKAVQKWRNDYTKGNRKIFEDPEVQIIDGRLTKIFKGKLADKKTYHMMFLDLYLIERHFF